MSGKNYKILYLSKGGHISGAQRQLLYLLRGLDRARFTPLVLCMQAGRFLEELHDLNVPCIVHKLAGWRRMKQFLTRYADVAYVSRLVRDQGISLVHSSDVWLSEYLLRSAGSSVRYEAMMCGTTVVCAWSRSAEESYHIRHNETGFLVTPRAREPVVQVLLDVIEHEEFRTRIGRNARLWAQEHLSHATLVQETQDLYERLLRD